MKFVNLTPHDVVLRSDDGTREVTFPSSGIVRCSTSRINLPDLDGWPVSRTEMGPPVGLPEPEEGVYYIVSFVVLQSLRGTRADLLAPDTTQYGSGRDSNGKIQYVRGFVQ